jgi:hypothetical protein
MYIVAAILSPEGAVKQPRWRAAKSHRLASRSGKRVKNKSSRRKLPLHPELLRCGILAYVDERRREGDARLFPQLRPSVSGQVTGNWSKWWGRYTDGLGITDPRKVFHSFRHTFKRACRAARIEEELHDALTGHTSASVGRSYGSGVPLDVLAEAIAKVSYKGLDLSFMHPAADTARELTYQRAPLAVALHEALAGPSEIMIRSPCHLASARTFSATFNLTHPAVPLLPLGPACRSLR